MLCADFKNVNEHFVQTMCILSLPKSLATAQANKIIYHSLRFYCCVVPVRVHPLRRYFRHVRWRVRSGGLPWFGRLQSLSEPKEDCQNGSGWVVFLGARFCCVVVLRVHQLR